LADGDLSDGATTPPEEGNGKAPARAHAVAGAGAAAGVTAGVTGRPRAVGLGSTATAARTEEQLTQADDDAMARILADASRRVARVPEGARDHALLAAVPDPGAPHAAGPTEVLGVPRQHDVVGNVESEGLRVDPDGPPTEGSLADKAPPLPSITALAAPVVQPGETPSAATTPTARAGGEEPIAERAQGAKNEGSTASAEARGAGGAKRTGATGAAAGAGGRAAEPAGAQAGGASGASPASTSSMVTGASMTSEELCAATGLSEIELAGLQGYGLIQPVMVAGIQTFDENALTVANLAAAFRKYGIEARHLRPYRNAVDREVGLIEQVIIPLLRQRNPESRQRAVDAADELGALGQTMRATLLRTALQRHVGG
jgi:hypothetical protein